MNLPLIVLGAGGHTKVVIDILLLKGCQVLGIVDRDPDKVGHKISGISVVGDDGVVRKYVAGAVELVNGIGSVSSTSRRFDIYKKFKTEGYSFANVIHPSAVISRDVQLGEGVQIMAGAVVQPGCKIGNNVLINTGVCVDHDCTIGDHVHLAPGVVLSGAVNVGASSHIGTSATIIQGVAIGESAVIAAGAVVIEDIAAGITVAGVPAKAVSK